MCYIVLHAMLIMQLRLKIRNKWNGKIPCVPGGKEKKFSLRFADSLKIECTADSPKV